MKKKLQREGIFKEMKEQVGKISEYKPGVEVKRVLPEAVGANNNYIERFMESAIKDSAWPGGVLLAAKSGNIFYHKGHGFHTYESKKPVRSSDIFDLASITKVISTTSGIMKLVDKIQKNKNLRLLLEIYFLILLVFLLSNNILKWKRPGK